VRNRFRLPTSLTQLEDVIQEDWYKILLRTVQNLYKSIQRKTAAVLKANGGPIHIYKEMCTVCVLLPLFSPTAVSVKWKKTLVAHFHDFPVCYLIIHTQNFNVFL
jgi:hypothetical protein